MITRPLRGSFAAVQILREKPTGLWEFPEGITEVHHTALSQDAQTPVGWESTKASPAIKGTQLFQESSGPCNPPRHCGREGVTQSPSALARNRALLFLQRPLLSVSSKEQAGPASLTWGHFSGPKCLFSDHQTAFINNPWEMLSRPKCCLSFHSGNGLQQSQYPLVPKG